jgi:hypothetical protein
MMDENNLVETWMLFREYLDKKQIEIVAEKFIDLLADHGVAESDLKSAAGSCQYLDEAIRYYLDEDEDDDEN